MRKLPVKRLLVLLAALLPVAAGAGLPDLTPVVARYKVTVNGIPAGTAATIDVQAIGNDAYQASFNVQNRFFRHQEVSRFDWHACRVVPREYVHEFTGLGIERHSALVFDRERNIAVETRRGKRQEIPLTTNVTDALNMAMLARCRLREGARTLDLPVIYRGERTDLQFDVAGEERIETPYGTFDTLVIERRYPQGGRRTRIWVAPALDWFMVRFEHIENPVARGSLTLTGFTTASPNTITSLKSSSPVAEKTP